MTISKLLLVSIPHAGVLCPPEIPPESLSEHQQQLAQNNVDWHTNILYDFRDILGNQQVVFPYSQVYINVNRHPKILDDSVPLAHDGIPVYRSGQEPSILQRQVLIKKYHDRFHCALARQQKCFIFDGHSTVSGHTDVGGNIVVDDIIVSDWQKSEFDPPEGTRTAPEGYLDVYVTELERRLTGLRIAVAQNTTYCATYGHIMATHGWDGNGEQGHKAPLLLQETNEKLYINNGVPDVVAIEELRRIFAEALSVLLIRINQTA